VMFYLVYMHEFEFEFESFLTSLFCMPSLIRDEHRVFYRHGIGFD
jgi:hypothetical protein